jgi:hypothetical protein
LMAEAFAALSLDHSDALRPQHCFLQAAKWGNQWTSVLKPS